MPSQVFGYPLPVSEEAQKEAKQRFGKNWTSQAFIVQDLKDKILPQGLSKENTEIFLEKLKELQEAIKKREPPEIDKRFAELLPQVRFYLSNDPERLGKDFEISLPYIAASKISGKEVYLHVIDFFRQTPAKQLEILYHELISHIAKGIRDEAEAMRDTQKFFNLQQTLSFAKSTEGLDAYLKDRKDAGEITSQEAEDTIARVNDWLTNRAYPKRLVAKLKFLIADKDWPTITESFFRVVAFGTAGKRGRQADNRGDILPGTNAINDYTVAEYTLGLARYLKKTGQEMRGVVLGGDTRIKSILPYRDEISYTELEAKILRRMGLKFIVLKVRALLLKLLGQ